MFLAFVVALIAVVTPISSVEQYVGFRADQIMAGVSIIVNVIINMQDLVAGGFSFKYQKVATGSREDFDLKFRF